VPWIVRIRVAFPGVVDSEATHVEDHARVFERARSVVQIDQVNSFKVPQGEQDELLGILRPLQTEIVEVESSATATPLPDTYQAAPPLTKA